MTFIRYLVLIGILLALGVPSAKADVRIDCPIDRAEVKIINPLPDGWSATPRVERLRDTRMDRIGGRKALICRYGSVGSIQFEQPPNTDCRTTRTGFVCRDERRPGPDRPETYRTGQLDIPQTFLFDLDQGRVTDAGADIWYQAENRTRKFLTPRNGAELSISGRRNRGYGDCARADFSANSIPLASIPLGTYICVRTNDGRISEFRINAIIPNGPTDTIRIGFTTWRNER